MATANGQEEAIFDAARRIEAPQDRCSYVQRACANDRALRARVEALLRVYDEEHNFLRPPRVGSHAAGLDLDPVREGPGARIGPYELLERLGEGGFGVVFLAQQHRPVRRKVALKVLKPGMDTRQVVARFEAERQALALMDHPHIAKVLDAGETLSGRPYFVMELVRGIPITDFCDRHQFSVRQRLGLFGDVCRAVQHAHQKGVIHRDLKPGNVLVTLHDGTPVVKVIDFGVAKAVGQQLTDTALVTHPAQVVGTPLYMSPEQATLGARDIDTRADIYTLGVLLYELLTGTTPFDRELLEEVDFDELRRIIREEEPAPPSARVSTIAEAAAAATVNRQGEAKRLRRLFRGELDWIVMKALEKDRDRRYESADALALDVQRYLADEPVQACPPSAGYRLRKFVRRHRGPVLAASLVALALVGGIAGTTVGLVQAERARRAEAERAAGEREARETAENLLAQVEKAADLLGSLFADLDPLAEEKEGRPLRAILGDRLDRAAAALEGEVVGDPLVVARLQDRLGQTYLGLGHAARAEELFTRAVTTRAAHLGPDHPVTLGSRYHQALAYEAAGKRTEDLRQFEQVRDAQTRVLGPDHPDTLATLHNLAWGYRLAGKRAEAVQLFERVRDGRVKQLGADHDDTLATLQMLAKAYVGAGKKTEAVALAEQVLKARVKKHGEDHPQAIAALNELAYAYQFAGRMKEALARFEQARDAAVPKLGPEHPRTLAILGNLAHMYRAYRRTPEAIALFEQVRERQERVLGARHPATLVTLGRLALAYQDAGDLDKALPLLEQAAAGVEKLQFVHGDAGLIIDSLCTCHEQRKQYGQAEVWRRKWLAAVKAKDGPESAAYARELTGLGWNMLRQHKHADAEPILREGLAVLRKKRPEDRTAFHAQSLLGAALLGQQNYAAAESHLVQGYQGMKKGEQAAGCKHHSSSTRDRLSEALERLVQLYDAWDKPDEAARWQQELEKRKQEP